MIKSVYHHTLPSTFQYMMRPSLKWGMLLSSHFGKQLCFFSSSSSSSSCLQFRQLLLEWKHFSNLLIISIKLFDLECKHTQRQFFLCVCVFIFDSWLWLVSSKYVISFINTFIWYPAEFTFHYIFLSAPASVLPLITALYPLLFPPLLIFFFSANNLNSSPPCPPPTCWSSPVIPSPSSPHICF